ncbi:MAG: phytanoyl-CoA dioxygenase family protein [Pseudomonadota bacterium]
MGSREYNWQSTNALEINKERYGKSKVVGNLLAGLVSRTVSFRQYSLRGGQMDAQTSGIYEPAWPAKSADSNPYREPFEVPHYHSRFGGLWTDLSNAKEIAEGKLTTGLLNDEEFEQVSFWIEKGYVIIKGAVSKDWIDELNNDLDRIWLEGHEMAWVSAIEDGRGVTRRLKQDDVHKVDNLLKLVDIYEYLESARRVSLAPAILRFMEIVFERPPLAHQSLSFNCGSKQPMHQDTAFVRVSSPMELTASWIALEDISPNTGELQYYEGSHRFDEFLFDGECKCIPPGNTELGNFYAHLESEASKRHLVPVKFYPKKGDALIWSADLAHGGSDYTDDTKTRKSLVTHYCPINCHPMYFHYGAHTGKRPWGNRAWWCAMKKEFWQAGA